MFFLLFISLPALAQRSPESVRARLYASTDPDSISVYLSFLAGHYLRNQIYDSAALYYKKALQYDEITNNLTRKGENLNNLGVLYFKLGEMDSSIFFYNSAHTVYVDLQDTLRTSALEINLGMLYKEKGLYEKSLEFLLNAARRLEKTESSAHLASCYNTIGNVYSKIGELFFSLEYHERSLAVKKKLGLVKGMASSYNNIGNVYILLKKYDSAYNNFKRSLDIKHQLNDKVGEGISLNNMGELMVKMGRLEEAESLLQEALKIRLETDDKAGQCITRKNLAQVYVLTDKLAKAEYELSRSEALATQMGLLEQLKANYEIQVMLFRKKNEPERALDYSERLLVIKDSLLNQEKAQVLAEMQTRYESMKKEDRIALLEKEGLLQAVELDRRQIWIRSLVLAVVLVFIIGVLIYYNLRTVRKNKVHIELLLKELHHRVKNNLQILSSLLSLQSQQLTDDNAIKAVKSSESRINAMALIHRKLYTVDQNRTVDIKEYITELIQYLVYSYGYHERNFKLDLEIPPISIDVDKAIPLGLILNELISNAFKHAYENQPNPRLMVNLAWPATEAGINIRITDNGGGMPEVDEKQRKTFGMKIVSTLIKELKGHLNVKSENGTTYDLHIPI